MTDFVPKSIVKSATREFTAPFVSKATFDGVITALLATENNPLGATSYVTTGGETVNGVTKASESYSATIEYIEEDWGETVGSMVVKADTRATHDAAITAALAATSISTAFGGDPVQNTSKDAWSVKLKVHDANGEIYYLSINRNSMSITSYESDSILTTVETWADTIPDLC